MVVVDVIEVDGREKGGRRDEEERRKKKYNHAEIGGLDQRNYSRGLDSICLVPRSQVIKFSWIINIM